MTVGIENNASVRKQVTAHHSPHCRACGNENLNRIPRGRLVKLFLFWLPIKKYVCYRCHRKTYRWGSRH